MKKLKFYSSVVAAALSVLTPVCGYAVGVSDVMSLSQGELAFYIVLGGAALAMIGSICLLFALLFKGRSSKEDYDEYYDDEYYDEYDDYDEEYEDSDEYEDDTYNEDSDSDDVEEIEDADDSINQENYDNDDNQTEEDTEEDNLPEEENIQAEEAVSDVSESDKDKDEASTDNESDIDNSKSDVNTDDKVMITLSGVNSSDVKIVEFTDFATVGRRNTNSLMIADNAVSGVHCKFSYSDGDVILEDMNSTNGTVLNDEKITSAKIKTGDIVIIGKCKYKLNVSVSKD